MLLGWAAPPAHLSMALYLAEEGAGKQAMACKEWASSLFASPRRHRHHVLGPARSTLFGVKPAILRRSWKRGSSAHPRRNSCSTEARRC